MEGGLFFVIVAALVALIVLAVVLFGASPILGGFNKETRAKMVDQNIKSCEVKGTELETDGKSFSDYDGDGLPDYCDNCPFTPNFGADVEDKDGDGFPVPIDSKNWVVWKEGGTEIRLCCGNDGIGGNNAKLVEKWEKYCETDENDMEHGPSKLISSYIT